MLRRHVMLHAFWNIGERSTQPNNCHRFFNSQSNFWPFLLVWLFWTFTTTHFVSHEFEKSEHESKLNLSIFVWFDLVMLFTANLFKFKKMLIWHLLVKVEDKIKNVKIFLWNVNDKNKKSQIWVTKTQTYSFW